MRNTVYFGGNEIGLALLVLAAYLVVGGLIVVAIRARTGKADTSEAEADAAAAVGAVVV